MQDTLVSVDVGFLAVTDKTSPGEGAAHSASGSFATGESLVEPRRASWTQRAAHPLSLAAAAAAHLVALAVLVSWTGDRLGDGVGQLDTITVSIETEAPGHADAPEASPAAAMPAPSLPPPPPAHEDRETQAAIAAPTESLAPAEQREEEPPTPAQKTSAPVPARDAAAAVSATVTGALPEAAAAPASAGVAREYAKRVATALSRSRPRGTGVSGTVRLRFVVDERGHPADVTVSAPSGKPSIDETAMRALARSELPVPPPGMTIAQRTFEVPYFFR